MQDSVIFLGSGPVAAKSLELLTKNFVVEAVITKPKPTHHKGNFPVIDVATNLGLPIHYVSNKQELDALISKQDTRSRVGIIIDFGIIVSQKVINKFPLGIVNSHFSLLPEWRGADPISFSVLSGQAKTGVSLMIIDAGMDTGKLITQKSLDIRPSDTTSSLTERLIELSDKLLQECLPGYLVGDIKPKNQPHPDRATYSRKLTKEDGIIDWNKPANQIEREIRAFIEWPKSRTTLAGKDIVMTSSHAHMSEIDNNLGIGDAYSSNKCLMIKCGEGYLCVEKLKPAGKNEMTAEAFLAGHKLT